MEALTLDILRKEFEQDSVIDDLDLDKESLAISGKFARWLGRIANIGIHLDDLEHEYNVLYRDKYEYYFGTMTDERLKELGWKVHPKNILKTNMTMIIDADTDIITFKKKLTYYRTMKNYADSAAKQISARSYQIRDAIEFIKFKNGSS